MSTTPVKAARKPRAPKTMTEALDKSRSHLGSDKAKQADEDAGKQGAETPAKAAPKTPVKRAPKQQAAKEPQAPEGDSGSVGAGDGKQGGDEVVSLTEVGQKQMLGGIEIEYAPIPSRGGQTKPETYPFSKLPLSTQVDGVVEGPSFFIPESDNPEKHLTNARKVIQKKKGQAEFLIMARTTKKDGVEGRRVWKVKNPKYSA